MIRWHWGVGGSAPRGNSVSGGGTPGWGLAREVPRVGDKQGEVLLAGDVPQAEGCGEEVPQAGGRGWVGWTTADEAHN